MFTGVVTHIYNYDIFTRINILILGDCIYPPTQPISSTHWSFYTSDNGWPWNWCGTIYWLFATSEVTECEEGCSGFQLVILWLQASIERLFIQVRAYNTLTHSTVVLLNYKFLRGFTNFIFMFQAQ